MKKPTAKTKTRNSGQNCRCLEVGVQNFGECLKEGPATCSYALPFGYCFLCTHPRVDEFIENAKKAGLAPTPVKF